ncbi:MAG: lipocalin family protein [Pyrinomonadaceae bacterium]
MFGLFDSIEGIASSVLEHVADAVGGPASRLRDGTEHQGVQLPRDLYAHREAQTEWWYYTGHLATTTGVEFGFEFVFFKRRTDLDKFGVVPLRLLGNPLYLAHFAVTEPGRQSFRYEHRKTTGKPWELTAEASEAAYRLQLGSWRITERDGQHQLYATLGDDVIFRANLRATKPPALNGADGVGVSFKDTGEASRYFSLTSLEATGTITWHGRTDDFGGKAWMDREFGTWRTTDNQKGWDWFAIQLENDSELMVYLLKNAEGVYTGFSAGTFVDQTGRNRHLNHDDFQLTAKTVWTSPHTNAIYPSSWELSVPSLGLELSVTPVMADQELDTRGSTMIIYWEGACVVAGSQNGAPVHGKAYVELVGYDRSHEQPSLTAFVLGNAVEKQWRSLFG